MLNVRAAELQTPTQPTSDDEPTLVDHVAVLLEGRWVIAGVTACALAAALIYASLATPRYRADILVQVEDRERGLGVEAFGDVLSGTIPAEAEMEIIRSRSLVGAVVDELSLDVVVRPRTFPVVGGAIARSQSGSEPRKPVLGLKQYAWGGERVAVERLDVPPGMLGEPLVLLAGHSGAFALRGPDGTLLLEGRVGEMTRGGGVSLQVGELHARPGTEITVVRKPRASVVRSLKRALSINELGRNTGMLQVALEGEDAKRVAATLDAVARTYVRQNVARKSAEAQQTLEFLETQLPQLKTRLESAEAALESYRARKGSVDVSLETQATLTRSVELERALSELEVQRAELKYRFTESHPLLATVQEKMRQLVAERASIDARLKKLPQAELDSARLLRDATVANELYVLLLNKAQELRVLKSGTVGNVRVVDTADVPADPVSPMKARALALALVFGMTAGVTLVFVRRSLNRGVEDPDAIERETGLAVYASIPRSEHEGRRGRADRSKVLAVAAPKDVAIESLRSLRTSLQFASIDAANPVLTVLGPAPSDGKTFVTLNLAAVLAESGRRVLVIDADLRKGRIHRLFGTERANGLSELISGAASPENVIRGISAPRLDLITTGVLPPDPANLLGSSRFPALLAEVGRRYDDVLIDTSPVLAATDAALIARHSGVNLLVVRAGHHPMREIALALKRLERSAVRVHGVVLNDVHAGTGYRKYHYHYAYEKA